MGKRPHRHNVQEKIFWKANVEKKSNVYLNLIDLPIKFNEQEKTNTMELKTKAKLKTIYNMNHDINTYKFNTYSFLLMK